MIPPDELPRNYERARHARRRTAELQRLAQWCHAAGREADMIAVLAIRARVLRSIERV
jgi:hypothetical protein